MQIEITIRHLPDGLAVDIQGALGKEGGEALLKAVQEQEHVPQRLILNFSGTGVVNTAGIGSVIWAIRLVAKAGGRSAAYGLSDHLRKVFHVMGLTHYLTLSADEADALSALRR